MDPDGTIQKEAFFEPLNDEEKFSLEPEHFRPEHIIMRRMMRDGIQPDDRNLLRIAKSYGYIPTAEERKAKSLAKAKKAKKAHISKHKTKRRDLASAALKRHFRSAGFQKTAKSDSKVKP